MVAVGKEKRQPKSDALAACEAMRLWVDHPQQITLEQVLYLVDAALVKARIVSEKPCERHND